MVRGGHVVFNRKATEKSDGLNVTMQRDRLSPSRSTASKSLSLADYLVFFDGFLLRRHWHAHPREHVEQRWGQPDLAPQLFW